MATEKPRENDAAYLAALRAMTPEQRLAKAFELTEQSRSLFWIGLRRRFPDLPEAQLRALYVQRLIACHNLDY
jgi:hypothetical protein